MRLQKVERLFLIRHGESKKNIVEQSGPFYANNEQRERVGVLQDRLIPLTEIGTRQARALGKRFKKNFGIPHHLFHSGYERTKQTTAGILKAYTDLELAKIEITEDHKLRERNPGHLTNFTIAEVMEHFPWMGSAWDVADPFTVVPLCGESIASMCEGRIRVFFAELEEHLPGTSARATVVLVSHGRAILAMRYLLEGWNYDQVVQAIRHENPPNCSVTCYTMDRLGNPMLQFANRVFHSRDV
jgi:broad specificity phosphatase PhoE